MGSGCRDASAYTRAIMHSRELFDEGAKIGHDMTILDLGGGYPGSDDERFVAVCFVLFCAYI